MITINEFEKALTIVKAYKQQCLEAITEINKYTDENYNLKNTLIGECDLSVRTLNVLYSNFKTLNYWTSVVEDLSNISRSELLKCRNFGKKSINEIDELCFRANIKMKP